MTAISTQAGRLDGFATLQPLPRLRGIRWLAAWMLAVLAVAFSIAMGMSSLAGSSTAIVAVLGLAGLAAAAAASLAAQKSEPRDCEAEEFVHR
jgi:hypothetical protein